MPDVIGTSPTGLPSRLTVVVVMRDHKALVERCLDSIVRELPGCPVLVVDVGSVDGSVATARAWAQANGVGISVAELPRDGSSSDALRISADTVRTDYICGISADDRLGDGYGVAAQALLSDSSEVFVCFPLEVVDVDGLVLEYRQPRWNASAVRNRTALLRGNPGTAPGAIAPIRAFQDERVWAVPSGSLIEDYWMWWVLLAKGYRAVNAEAGFVCYTRHAGSLTNQRLYPKMSWSLGVCAGIALSMARTPADIAFALQGVARFGRRVPPKQIGAFWGGLRRGRQVMGWCDEAAA